MMFRLPIAQASLVLLLPQIAIRAALVPDGTELQTLPSQCRMVPAAPTAQTSLAALPHRSLRVAVVPDETMDQPGSLPLPWPVPWTIVPASPTAQRSLELLPQTLFRELPDGRGLAQHQPLSEHVQSG